MAENFVKSVYLWYMYVDKKVVEKCIQIYFKIRIFFLLESENLGISVNTNYHKNAKIATDELSSLLLVNLLLDKLKSFLFWA